MANINLLRGLESNISNLPENNPDNIYFTDEGRIYNDQFRWTEDTKLKNEILTELATFIEDREVIISQADFNNLPFLDPTKTYFIPITPSVLPTQGGIVKSNLLIGTIVKGTQVVFNKEYISDGLVQHYDTMKNNGVSYDPLVSTWTDLSGNNDGTIENGVWTERALQFDGTARVKFEGVITPNYTIMGTFLRYSTQNAHPRLFGENPYPTMYLTTASYRYSIYGQGVDTTFLPITVMPANKYVHLAIRYDSSAKLIELFEDGIKVAERPVSSDAIYTQYAYLGSRNTSDRYLQGEICNFMRYNRVLSDEEIVNNFLIDREKYIHI
jgi:hypothetical protein